MSNDILSRKAMDECLWNVDQYIEDIKLLIDNGSYGHAYALSIIGAEELAKAMAYFWSGPNDLKELIIESLSGGRSAHHDKITFFLLLSQLSDMKALMEQGVSPLDSLKHVFSKEISNKKYIKKTRREISKLNTKKMNGFYVDVKKGKIISPRKIIKEEAKKSLYELENNKKLVIEMLTYSLKK